MMLATKMLHTRHFYLLEATRGIQPEQLDQTVSGELYEWFVIEWVEQHKLNPTQHTMLYEMLKAFVAKHMVLVQMGVKKGHQVCEFRVTQIQFSLPTTDDPFKAPAPRHIVILAGCGGWRWGQYDEMYKLAVQDFVFETHEAVGIKDGEMVMKNSHVQFSASYQIRDVSHDQETAPSSHAVDSQPRNPA